MRGIRFGTIAKALWVSAWGGIIVAASLALAQEPYPTRPVTIWVGFPPGGAIDILTRILAEGAEKSLGQKLVVVNKPGGGATVAASQLARTKPDGYTIASATDTPVTRAPHLRDLDYDPFRDLTYLIQVGLFKLAFVVRADSPFKSWREVIEWARKNPGQLVFGQPGVGTTPHLTMAKVGIKDGFPFKSVPFAGDTPTVNAVLGGHVMLGGVSSLAVRSHIEAKAMRVLAVSEKEGLDYAPEAPTLAKLGYDLDAPTSVIFLAPKGIPDPVRERLEKAFSAAMNTENFRGAAKRYELIATEPLTGKALVDYLARTSARYEQLVKEAGIYKIERK